MGHTRARTTIVAAALVSVGLLAACHGKGVTAGYWAVNDDPRYASEEFELVTSFSKAAIHAGDPIGFTSELRYIWVPPLGDEEECDESNNASSSNPLDLVSVRRVTSPTSHPWEAPTEQVVVAIDDGVIAQFEGLDCHGAAFGYCPPGEDCGPFHQAEIFTISGTIPGSYTQGMLPGCYQLHAHTVAPEEGTPDSTVVATFSVDGADCSSFGPPPPG